MAGWARPRRTSCAISCTAAMFPSSGSRSRATRQARLPVCEFPDGTRMESPTIRQVIEKLGWFANPSRAEYDLAIYGAGPAGLSAAGYGSSRGLKTVLVERWAIGGAGPSSPTDGDHLGVSEGTNRPQRAERTRGHAYKSGA